MSLKHRLHRLEALELEHWMEDRIYEEAKRMAVEYGRGAEDIVAELRESAQRIRRYGMDAEIRQMALEFGKTEDEVRAELEAIKEEMQRAAAE